MPMQKGDVKETFADCGASLPVNGFQTQYFYKEGIKEFCDWYINYYKNINS